MQPIIERVPSDEILLPLNVLKRRGVPLSPLMLQKARIVVNSMDIFLTMPYQIYILKVWITKKNNLEGIAFKAPENYLFTSLNLCK